MQFHFEEFSITLTPDHPVAKFLFSKSTYYLAVTGIVLKAEEAKPDWAALSRHFYLEVTSSTTPDKTITHSIYLETLFDLSPSLPACKVFFPYPLTNFNQAKNRFVTNELITRLQIKLVAITPAAASNFQVELVCTPVPEVFQYLQ